MADLGFKVCLESVYAVQVAFFGLEPAPKPCWVHVHGLFTCNKDREGSGQFRVSRNTLGRPCWVLPEFIFASEGLYGPVVRSSAEGLESEVRGLRLWGLSGALGSGKQARLWEMWAVWSSGFEVDFRLQGVANAQTPNTCATTLDPNQPDWGLLQARLPVNTLQGIPCSIYRESMWALA